METKDKDLEQEYTNSLTEKEKKALEIAKKHLGSLFTLSKTAGYIHWFKQNKTK
jgi:hypothetical protein